MILITDDLARRLEQAAAMDDASCAETACSVSPQCEAAVSSVGGGFLTFCGPNSPLTHAVAIGLSGPVSTEELDEIEHFFHSRDSAVTVDVTPHTDPGLRDMLCDRGYVISEFTNVLVRALSGSEAAPICPTQSKVRQVQDRAELDLHARTMLAGFMSRPDLAEEELALGLILVGMPYTRAYLAEVGNEPAGASCLSIRNGVGNCFGDSTLPAFRGAGVHTAMICARIATAISEGCELMTASTQPGSGSQRNYQRLGFVLAYSKVTMVLE